MSRTARITACQSAKVRAAVNLQQAEELLLSCRSLCCFDPSVVTKIDELADAVFDIRAAVMPSNTTVHG